MNKLTHPLEKDMGDKVTGGTVNSSGSFIICAKRVGSDTLLGQIVNMVGEAQCSRAPIQGLANPALSKNEGVKVKAPGRICLRRALPPSIHGRVLPHSEAASIGANSSIGASAERRGADFPGALSAGHQLRTKAKR